MRPKRLSMFVKLFPTPNAAFMINGRTANKVLVTLTFTDISRCDYFHEDPADKDRTMVCINREKFSVPLTKEQFRDLLDDIKEEELFSNMCMN